ncbi:MAG: YncE family protein [Acidimicrobiales bacterium]
MDATQLIDGLGGGLGCRFVAAQNRLYFVEDHGKVSALDLVRSLDAVVSEGIADLPPDTSLDLISGAPGGTGHVRWDQWLDGRPAMRPQGPSRLSYVGVVDYDSVTPATMQALTYDAISLPAEQMANGVVFGVNNFYREPGNDWDFAKVQVLDAGETLKVQWQVYRLQPAYFVLGTGYDRPRDIAVTAGGRYAYVTEQSGTLLRVDLTYAKRPAAEEITSGLASPQQIALDEPRARAYVVESEGDRSRLTRVDLTSRATQVVAGGLRSAVGVVVTRDGTTAYVTENEGGASWICRISLATGHRERLPAAIGTVASLSWGWGGESQLLTADVATNEVLAVELSGATPTVRRVAAVASGPASVAAIAADAVLVCCAAVIVRIRLTPYASTRPLLLGIGHVPRDDIRQGYATTEPGYFFSAKDAPFGGTLPIMVNHLGAWLSHGRYYQVLVDGAVQTRGWSDELFVTAGESDLTPARTVGPFFAVRSPAETWQHPWLGYFLDTTAFADGDHVVEIRLFAHPDASSEIDRSDLLVRFDNTAPRAAINQIIHYDESNPDPARRRQVVGPCGIVQGTSDQFGFVIEAHDPVGQHLGAWSLGVVWGDNRSAAIASDSYDPGHVTGPPHAWAGVIGELPSRWTATVRDDPSSRRCAHTFSLQVWDRVIDGWRYLHQSGVTKSVTLLLSDPGA